MRELLLDLDAHGLRSGSGRRSALEAALRTAIRSGRLVTDSVLPSTRALAHDLGLSRSTVVSAYEQLTAEGYLSSDHGSATRVAFVNAAPESEPTVDVMGPNPTFDFRPGAPDSSAFPRVDWQRSLRRVLTEAPDVAFDYPDPLGVSALRAALADHLSRTRALQASAAAVRVYGGFGSALGFVGEALRRRGVECIAVEAPGFPLHVGVLRLAGLRTVPVAVDADGIDIERLAAADVGAVLVTPAHQYPTGATLSSTRRRDLIDWARRRDAWIIEDDYDGEFRYDRRPIGAVQGLAPDRVIYGGTASKALGPALRIGWIVVPSELRDDVLRVTHVRAGVSAIDQLALADHIASGRLDRHVRQQRTRYQRRRERLSEMLAVEAPWLSIMETAAGLHLATTIVDDAVTERSVLDVADRLGVGLVGVRTHHGPSDASPGFPIGFSRPSEHGFTTALDRLAAALRSV